MTKSASLPPNLEETSRTQRLKRFDAAGLCFCQATHACLKVDDRLGS
jgi:hypothetical protein